MIESINSFSSWQITCLFILMGLGIYFTFIKPFLKRNNRIQEFVLFIENFNNYNYELILDILDHYGVECKHQALALNPLYLDRISSHTFSIPYNTEVVVLEVDKNFPDIRASINVDNDHNIFIIYYTNTPVQKFNAFIKNEIQKLTKILADKYHTLKLRENKLGFVKE